MTNQEYLEILGRGVAAWNEWRSKHPEKVPNLSRTDLSEESFFNANLSFCKLIKTDLTGSTLIGADLTGAILIDASLRAADLAGANLSGANLSGADFSGAYLLTTNLSGATLHNTTLSGADLSGANLFNAKLLNTNLSHAKLIHANFKGADVTGANVTGAITNSTAFIDIDLSEILGLESISHLGPSEISVSTIYRSGGQTSEVFLRGCGLSDWEIESTKLYQLDLDNETITNILYRIHDLRAHHAIQLSPLFISYNHSDSGFVDKIEQFLYEKGVRFWRDVHHAIAGRLESQIDRAIRLNPTVLLILSEHSVQSDWVQHEARMARKLEIETKRDVLCPVALDDSWKTCDWPERLREQIMEYNILDFSNWNNEDKFRRMFSRLLEGLNLFYK